MRLSLALAACVAGALGQGQAPPQSYATDITCDKVASGANGIGVAEACGSTAVRTDGPAFAEPTTVTSSNGRLSVVLEVRDARVDYGAFEMTQRVFCLEGGTSCGVPGPTLVVRPGDVLDITLRNELPEGRWTGSGEENELREPDVVNLHTHGLHVDPSVDNVRVAVHPGEEHRYEIDIPEDHMAGLHWYHPHHHGSSALQVAGGLAGAIIVLPADADALPSAYTAMESHTLVLSHHNPCSCNPTTDPFRLVGIQELRDGIDDPLDWDIAVGPEGISDVYLVNGLWQPRVESMAAGEWHRFDMVNAVGDAFLEVVVAPTIGALENDACDVRLLALDGVFLTDGPRDVDVVALATGSRASVAVMCETAGTYYLQTVAGQRAADYEQLFTQNLVTLSVGGAVDGSTARPAWAAADMPRPFYLEDLRSATVESRWEMGVEQTAISGGGAWLGVGPDCALECSGRDCDADPDPNAQGECPYEAFVAGAPYRHVGRLCGVEEMVIQGRGRTGHPMHIHVHHFQIVSAVDDNGRDSPSYGVWGEIGDFRDTMPAIAGSTTARYVNDKYGGQIMLHCHFLLHEDLGMMATVFVGDADQTPCTVSGGGSTGNAVTYCTDVPADAHASTYAPIIGSCSGADIDFDDDDTSGSDVDGDGSAQADSAAALALSTASLIACAAALLM